MVGTRTSISAGVALSVVVHVWGGYALWKFGNDVTPRAIEGSREIVLDTRSMVQPLAPALAPPPPPPEPKPKPKPEPKPELKPEPPPAEPEEPVARLGIAESDQKSKAWIGYKDPTEHQGRLSEVDQSAMSPAPGIPAPLGGQPSPASPEVPSSAPVPAQAAATVPAAAPPQESKPAPQQPTPASPKPTPATESISADSTAVKSVEPPVEGRQGIDAAAVVQRAEPPRSDASRNDEKDVQGTLNAKNPEGAARPSPSRKPLVDLAGGELPAAREGEPDAKTEEKLPPRKDQTPAAAPKVPDGAMMDPKAEVRLEGLKDSTVIDPDPTRAGSADGTEGNESLTKATPAAKDVASTDPAAEPVDPDKPAEAEAADPDAENSDAPKPDSAEPTDASNAPATAPASAPTSAPSPAISPSAASKQQDAGVPISGERVGETDDREADASSVKRAIEIPLRNGRVAAGEGLELRTVRPRFSTTTLLTSNPKNPVLWIRFGRDGRVADADFVKGFSSGYENIDSPLKDAVLRWRASGKKLEELPPGDGQGVTLIMRIILR
jgi:hypothetical protein